MMKKSLLSDSLNGIPTSSFSLLMRSILKRCYRITMQDWCQTSKKKLKGNKYLNHSQLRS